MRLVSRKLRSSCCNDLQRSSRSDCHETVSPAAIDCDSMDSRSRRLRCTRAGAAALATSLVKLKTAPGAVAGQAPLAGRPCAHVAPDRRAGAVLRIRRGAVLPRRRRARRRRGAARAPASCGWRRSIASASPRRAALTAEVASSISDLQFTAAYRVPFQFSRFVREHLQRRIVPAVVVGRDGHRSRRQQRSTT